MWPIHLINLADNTGRLDRSAAQFEAAGVAWQRVDGVNGWKMDDAEVAKVYDADRNARDGKHALVRPEIGCYLSHVKAWQTIANSDAPGGFIFEDDFAADATLGPVLEAMSAPQDAWDMVKLFSFDPAPQAVQETQVDGVRVVIPYRVPTCLIAYGVTKAAAAHLAERAIPFFRPVDEDQKFVWETGLRVAVALPTPVTVGEQEAATGTIGSVRRATRSGRSVVGQTLHNLRYQMRYRSALKRHWAQNGPARS